MAGFPSCYRTTLQPPGALGELGLVWALGVKDSKVHWEEVRERPGEKGTDGVSPSISLELHPA